jgi:cobalt/nickel transport system permease protein
MHIPDGFLDGRTAAGTAFLAVSGLCLALREAGRTLPPSGRPLMGVAAAFVFAAQMLNFPVAGGTSGHLMGSALAAVLLGPSAAIVVMSAVLLVQCFLFNDGGILALGANLFNMGFAGTLGGYAVFRALRVFAGGEKGLVFASAFAGWCATMLAALCCASELVLSGTAEGRVVFPAMMHVHMIIGLGEGLITGMVLAVIYRTRPDLIESMASQRAGRRAGSFALYALVAALALVFFLAPRASSMPDGLERAAQDAGFASKAAGPLVPGPMSGYALPGVHSESWATIWAGMAGTIIAFIMALALAAASARRNHSETPRQNAPPTA